MNRQFLEFWGNFLVEVAKGQKQLEDFTKWTSQGLKGFEDLTALFRKAYGLENLQKDSPDYLNMWKNAEEDFWKSYRESMSWFGIVPREEHLELVKKYEDLKKKCEAQEETIKHLRMLLEAQSGVDYKEMTKGFQELAQKQSDQFQKMMETFHDMFKKDISEKEK